jgi:hypothetical protein
MEILAYVCVFVIGFAFGAFYGERTSETHGR